MEGEAKGKMYYVFLAIKIILVILLLYVIYLLFIYYGFDEVHLKSEDLVILCNNYVTAQQKNSYCCEEKAVLVEGTVVRTSCYGFYDQGLFYDMLEFDCFGVECS